MRQHYGGPTLPKELRDQIGDPSYRSKNGRPPNNGPFNRKERRKAERDAKKSQKQQPRKVVRESDAPNKRHHGSEARFHKWSTDSESEPTPRITSAHAPQPGKSILKKPNAPKIYHGSDDEEEDRRWSADSAEETSSRRPPERTQKLRKSTSKKPEAQISTTKDRLPSPPPRLSRAAKDRLAQDDAEIAALEKKLGVRGKKKAKASEDGLDGLFGDFGAFSSDEGTGMSKGAPKRKREKDNEWLASKRRKALGNRIGEDDDEASDLEELGSDDVASDRMYGDSEEPEGDLDQQNGGSDFEDFDSDEHDGEEAERAETPRVRENPYIAPVAPGTQPAKYIPPALRAPPASDAEAMARLKRQIQGLLNRLSDANMMTILRDFEQAYQNNPRGYVTTILIDLLIGLLSDESTLPDTFLILHAGFIAAIYKVIGPDFGAQVVERIVSEFDRHFQRNKKGSGKQTTNLMTVVAELYCFQLIGSNLVFDYIKLFLDELSEIHTELLLRLVRVSGSQLRQDDPSSLKDIVLLLQKSVAKTGQDNLPVRTKFMIETINDLKNNRMKTAVAASAIASEHTIRMKKQLGTLNTRNLKGTEPLRIGLADIRNTEKKGKWWLVGASWRNDNIEEAPTRNDDETQDNELGGLSEKEDDGEVDLFQLAREQRMNTDVRRAIFISIMSATDYKEAHVRLLKLNLKRAQEMEIPRIIVHCAGCEDTYNPYYTLLARKFCADHKSRKSFQFALWDVFKSLGEKRDEDDDASEDEGDGLSGEGNLRRLVNLGKLYGSLIAKDGLSVTSLKILNFPYLKPKTKTLIEVLLVTVILESQKGSKGKRDEKALLNIFINVDSATEMIPGLQYFMKKKISRTDITANKKEKETVKWACTLVMDMLQRLMATTAMDED